MRSIGLLWLTIVAFCMDTLLFVRAFAPRPTYGSFTTINTLSSKSSSPLLPLRSSNDDMDFNANSYGAVEQIEFKIYPDGRIEETVRGIRGNNCHKVTEAINEKLGEVVASAPTEEMYEQEIVLDQTLIQTNSEWSGSSTW